MDDLSNKIGLHDRDLAAKYTKNLTDIDSKPSFSDRIADEIAALREAKGLTQVVFAGRIGISRQYLCEIETKQKRPSLEVLDRIDSEFGLSVT